MLKTTGLVLGLALLSSAALAGSPTLSFHIVKKVANVRHVANNTDPKLINPWGLDRLPGGAIWVADEGSDHLSTYNARTGNKLPTRQLAIGGPTGLTYLPPDGDGTGDFKVTNGDVTERSFFAVATTGGQVLGVNPEVDSRNALPGYDGTGQGAAFTGLGFGANRRYLLAADFANGQVDMIDGNWSLVGTLQADPNLPAGYAPFGIRVIKGDVYVTYAQRDEQGEEVKGAGLGIVDVYKVDGHFVRRLVSEGGALNAPWGLTPAPKDFGPLAGALLVGNFGDGKINAYDTASGNLLATLSDSNGDPLVIDGLWGLLSTPGGEVSFTAGPNDEQDGLIGAIVIDTTGTAKK
jgi:uncharacterized protein (TIGR03118 family)